MFRYKLHTADGDDLGEAVYAQTIKLGEEIFFDGALPRSRCGSVR